MDHKSKDKTQNNKAFRKHKGEYICKFWVDTQKPLENTYIYKLDLIKFKIFAHQKKPLRKWVDKLQGRKKTFIGYI